MKKIFFVLLTLTFLFSCGGGSNGSATLIPGEFSYQILTNEAELKTLVNGIFSKVGDNMSKLDEIDISVNRPSKIGFLKREKDPDNIFICLCYLNPQDPKTLLECIYNFDSRSWGYPQKKTVQLLRGDVESFVLANEMMDASALTSDRIAQIVKIAWDKYKDDAKYNDQWVSHIAIKKGKIEVRVQGLLESNGLEKSESYAEKL